jgi:hypothetical protein
MPSGPWMMACCLVSFSLPILAAQVASITLDPNAVAVGQSQHWTTSYNNNLPGTPVKWVWQAAGVDPWCQGPAVTIPGLTTDDVWASWRFPGKYFVILNTTYQFNPVNLVSPTTTYSGPHDVYPPNKETLVGGVPVILPLGGETTVTTKWTYNATSITMDASTVAEEKIKYIVPISPVIDWHPGEVGNWLFVGDTLMDDKAYNLSPGPFDSLAPGTTLTFHWQKNRLKFRDYCNQIHTVEGPTRLYRRTKVVNLGDPTGRYYQIEEVDPASFNPPLVPPF